MVDRTKINPYMDLYGLNGGNNDNEKQLVRDLVGETIAMLGIAVKYLPRTLQKEDTLFGEDVLSSFDSTYDIPMYLENVEGYEGEGEFLQKFGLSITDSATMIVATDVFNALLIPGYTTPLEGDLLYFPLSKGLFEIKFVQDENQFYPSGTLPQYKLTVELFTFSSETFNTTDTDIDSISNIDQITGVDPSADNDNIQTEAADYLDFEEDNPWGDF